MRGRQVTRTISEYERENQKITFHRQLYNCLFVHQWEWIPRSHDILGTWKRPVKTTMQNCSINVYSSRSCIVRVLFVIKVSCKLMKRFHSLLQSWHENFLTLLIVQDLKIVDKRRINATIDPHSKSNNANELNSIGSIHGANWTFNSVVHNIISKSFNRSTIALSGVRCTRLDWTSSSSP